MWMEERPHGDVVLRVPRPAARSRHSGRILDTLYSDENYESTMLRFTPLRGRFSRSTRTQNIQVKAGIGIAMYGYDIASCTSSAA